MLTILLLGDNEEKLQKLKDWFTAKLPANDLENAKDFLSIKLVQGSNFIALTHSRQIKSLVDEVSFTECRNIAVPGEISGDLSTVDDSPADVSFPCRIVEGVLLYIARKT